MAKANTIRIDRDLDAQSPAADLVRVYLNGIGKTALLNAADEVELAKRIEAGLYAAPVFLRAIDLIQQRFQRSSGTASSFAPSPAPGTGAGGNSRT